MIKTKKSDCNSILVDTESLKNMLGCGRPTAVQIGNLSNARVKVNRRLFWKVSLVEKYLENIAE